MPHVYSVLILSGRHIFSNLIMQEPSIFCKSTCRTWIRSTDSKPWGVLWQRLYWLGQDNYSRVDKGKHIVRSKLNKEQSTWSWSWFACFRDFLRIHTSPSEFRSHSRLNCTPFNSHTKLKDSKVTSTYFCKNGKNSWFGIRKFLPFFDQNYKNAARSETIGWHILLSQDLLIYLKVIKATVKRLAIYLDRKIATVLESLSVKMRVTLKILM
jgi:hypothetical protein